MTDSTKYKVRGAEVTVTATVYPTTIDVHLTLDLSPLDVDEPDHSPHQLITYLNLAGYKTGQTYWWAKTHRTIKVRTGAQAHRVIKAALAKIDDAVEAALIARAARKSHMQDVFPGRKN